MAGAVASVQATISETACPSACDKACVAAPALLAAASTDLADGQVADDLAAMGGGELGAQRDHSLGHAIRHLVHGLKVLHLDQKIIVGMQGVLRARHGAVTRPEASKPSITARCIMAGRRSG